MLAPTVLKKPLSTAASIGTSLVPGGQKWSAS
jgi:hypothetical protein